MDLKKDLKKVISGIVVLIIAVLGYFFNFDFAGTNEQDSDTVTIYYIDVGQADSTLIVSKFGNMLIDGGESETEKMLVEFIKSKGITTLDYVVATHPHSDHIGGLDKVIDSFDVKNVLITNGTNNTTSYEKLLNSIKNKNITPKLPKSKDKFSMGDIQFTVLNPSKDAYDNLNNYSIAFKMVYDNTSFLFSADAEQDAEKDILNLNLDISADVYKVAHHGSYTSSSDNFFNSINPMAAIISCGKDNSYGHPHKEILSKLDYNGVQVYRTDLSGTIKLETDGKQIVINGDIITRQEKPTEKIYVDENGNGLIKGNINSKGDRIYHMPGGAYYEQTVPEKIFKTEQEAIDDGFKKSGR